MKKIVKLTESDLMRIVKRVLKEQEEEAFASHPAHGEKWLNKDDRWMDEPDIELTSVREFGPGEYEDFMEFINGCNVKWCNKVKHLYDMYAEHGKFKVGKGRRW